jgi:MoxR-like ATPase
MDAEEKAHLFRERVALLKKEIGKVIVGHEEVIDQVVLAVLSGGHVLLEGVPGLGKTLLVRTVAEALRLEFRRIQFTPDLMPADILGTNIVVDNPEGNREFRFQKGPVFGNIILADEINRATPKTQSALLEAMQEGAVTVSGIRHPLPSPFFVLATQNPIEMEGTYPLPEAQIDRFFFKILVQSPDLADLVEVINRTTGEEPAKVDPVLTGEELLEMRDLAREIPIASHVKEFAARLVLATHPSDGGNGLAKKYLRYGSSPRGAQSMVLAGKVLALTRGRYNVAFKDLRDVALPALRHRLILNFEAEAEGVPSDRILEAILADLPETAETRT